MIWRGLMIFLAWFGLIHSALPQAITTMLKRNKIDPSQVSILIRETHSQRTVVAWEPDRERIPASVMKLYTTYSALLDLGPNFRWPTKLYYSGTFRNGTITGDLIVEAFGDPTLRTDDLHRIARRLRTLGVRNITGNLLLDRSFFATDDRVTSGFDRNLYSEYNAMPDALMLNDHMSSFVIRPQAGTIVATKTIPNDAYDLINHLQPVNTACKGKNAWPYVGVKTENGRAVVVLRGTLSTHCPKRRISKLLTHTHESFYHAFKAALAASGIAFGGHMVLARVPRSARALMLHRSRPLLSIVSKTLKKSNNLYARHIFLLLGAQNYGAPATEAKGAKAVASILKTRGVWDRTTRIVNGSGLSRRARTTARALVRLLDDAYRHYGKQWLNALSIAGKDGTIRKRFRHSIAKGRAWMKTGTLNRAKNIAGYVKGKSGRLYTVAILYNGAQRWNGSALQNQIIEWLARR
jgi:D-alanyl-D-alanine carboxypeptidase/D-alanyl-D-alanine-endopeptidase (penicillin-binding protein 4)